MVFWAALASVALAQQQNFLAHEELKALLSSTRTVAFTAGTSARGTGIYSPDGIARLDGGTWSAKGTWRIDGNRFCTTYPGIRRGYETCSNLQKTGENRYNLYFSTDGTKNGTWAIEK